MEIVVFRSDIARLVLGYLKSHNLVRASQTFCKTSPHLKEELNAYKQGLQSFSFFPDLEEIICEYVLIKQKADSSLRRLPDKVRVLFQYKKLSDVISELILIAIQAILHDNSFILSDGVHNISNSKYTQSPHVEKSNAKRKRSLSRGHNGYESNSSAKRLKPNPFCYLMQRRAKCMENIERANRSESGTNSESESDETSSSSEASESHSEGFPELNKTRESTPLSDINTAEYKTPSVPEMRQAILENKEFTERLAQHINEGLKQTKPVSQNSTVDIEVDKLAEEELNLSVADQNFDNVVKNIVTATEKDPELDAIIQELIDGVNKKTNTPLKKPDEEINPPKNEALLTSNDPNTSVASSNIDNLNINNSQLQPKTPLIIRNAITAFNSNETDAQNLPLLPINTSFGSMIDPNFSLSKLIFLNATSSCQKNNVDPQANANQSLNEAILSQLDGNMLENTPAEQPIHVDPTSGQISFPVFLTNEGLIANFPIIINNELLNQDMQATINSLPSDVLLQPVSLPVEQLPSPSKATGSTPKAATKDQKSVAPKTLELCQQTVNKLKETNYQMISASVDSKLLPLERSTPSTIGIVNVKALRSLSTPRKRESHVRTLTFSPKSLLPKTLINASRAEANKRLVSKEDQSLEEETQVENNFSDKPIIKTVEIINPVPGTSIPDINSNESNSSCHVPPLFRNDDEYSNQTMVHCDPSAASKPLEATASTSAETPKRKQPRRMAGRACKLKLVPSPAKAKKPANNTEKAKKPKTKSEKTEDSENLDKVDSKNENAECKIAVEVTKEETAKSSPKKQVGLEEWMKFRSLTTNDLDSHLREINASQEKNISNKRVPRKRIRRKKTTVQKEEKDAGAAGPEQEPNQNQKQKANDKISITPVHEVDVEDKSCKSQPKTHINIRILHNEKNINKEIVQSNAALTGMSAPFSARMPENEHMLMPRNTVELEKRTANIAHLLETPFKQTKSDCGKSIPPTPGILPLSLSTPLPKARLSDEILHSESYLFGSIGKSDLDTPMHSAVTPGFRLHPFGSKDATPLSLVPSEYSSCSSYYKPDENADIDKNLEKMMKDSEKSQAKDNTNENNGTAVVAPAIGLVVDPIIIKRMTSANHNRMEIKDDPKDNVQLQYSLVSTASDMGELAYNTSTSSSSSIINNTLVSGNKTSLDSASNTKDVSKFVPADCELSQLHSIANKNNDGQKITQRNSSTHKKPHLTLSSIAEINEDAAVYNLNLHDENIPSQTNVINTDEASKPNEDKNKYFSMFSSSSKASEFHQFAAHQISSQNVEPAKVNYQTKDQKQTEVGDFEADHRSIELLNALQLSAKKGGPSTFASGAGSAATILKTTKATPAKNSRSTESAKSKAKGTEAETQTTEVKSKKTCKTPDKTKTKLSSGKASGTSSASATGKSSAKAKKTTNEKKLEPSHMTSKSEKSKGQALQDQLQPPVSDSHLDIMQPADIDQNKVNGNINTCNPVTAAVENEPDDFDERVITLSENIAESSFFHFVYDESKGVVPPIKPMQRNTHLETYSMCVEIDNGVNCTLRVGDEICLCCSTSTDCQQQQKNIKNIPKKRHIRNGNNEDGGKNSTKTKLSEKNLQDCTISEHICDHNTKIASSKSNRDSNSLYKAPSGPMDIGDSLVALKNFDDIENILSQLHGT